MVRQPYIEIYCDGCALNNGKPDAIASYGAVLRFIDENGNLKAEKEISGLCNPISSTNNYAEVSAAIEALSCIIERKKLQVKIFSDSKYLINAMNAGWSKEANQKLFDILDELIKTFWIRPEFQWVAGHSGNVFNERADKLSEDAARRYANEHGIKFTLYRGIKNRGEKNRNVDKGRINS